ncbi:MAG: kinase [Xanthomonadaceae bacterium]|nr:kinase [Xanthomonadaceae bacterium]
MVTAALDEALSVGRLYAIGGVQGSGKSTLAAQMAALGAQRGLRVATLSLDDVYLGLRERRRLGREVHPLLATRGPPGTHDLALACETLDALRDGRAVRLPRFDKLRDRRLPPSRWPLARDIDLTVFEGWCLKVPAQTATALRRPVNALEREEDADGVWRRACNEALGRDYPALWARLPHLLWLQAPGFAPVVDWRWRQERAMRARTSVNRGQTRAEIARFVQHFERVSRHALRVMPAVAERCLRLDAEHRVRAMPPRSE